MSIDLEAIRQRLDWMQANEERAERDPGPVTQFGYVASAISCAADVAGLLAEVERLTGGINPSGDAEPSGTPIRAAWMMTGDQVDALRALLSLVHYDALAQSWLDLLPAEFHPERIEVPEHCPAHGPHPHGGMKCLDCATCPPFGGV